MLSMSKAQSLYIGADIGGSKIRTAVFDGAMQPLCKNQMPSRASEGRDALLVALNIALSQALEQAASCVATEFEGYTVAGIGISTAGVVDADRGCIVDATDAIPAWSGTALADWLRARFALPVVVENDVKTALVGELLAAPELQQGRVVMLTLGTGLGGAIAEYGRIVNGAHFVAGHFGRMPMPNPWGGRSAVPLEDLVSGSGLAKVANRMAGEPVFADGHAVLDGCESGHAMAMVGLDRFCDFLVMALEQVYWSLDPDHILIGGGLVEAQQQWWPMLQGRLVECGLPIPVQAAQLHNDAGVHGAGALIRAYTIDRSRERSEESSHAV